MTEGAYDSDGVEIVEPIGKLSPAERVVFDRIHNPITINTTAEPIIETAKAVFPDAVHRETRAKAKVRPTIIIDQQEKLPLTRWFDETKVRVEVAHLETGDYSLAGATGLLAIERKGLADLLGCITSDRERFMDQMRRLKNYPSRFLIIEATRATIEAEAYRPDVRASSIVGTLLGLAVRWNICVVYCKDQKEAAERVQWICLKVAQLQKEGFYDNAPEQNA